MTPPALRRGLAALGCASAALGAQPRTHAEYPPVLDSARLVSDIASLAADSMEGRRIGTAGGARARAFLQGALIRTGLEAVPGGFTFPFTAKERFGGELHGVNLLGMVRGTEHPGRYVIVSAHYDHLGVRGGDVFNGADDNASGAAALLAIAAWTRAHRPRNSLLFAWFDGEESGLLGAKAFLDRPPVPIADVEADVNLDMVSRSVKDELFAAGATPWPVMRPLLDSVAAGALVTLRIGHDSGLGQDNWIQQSDQGPFHERGIPFVYFGVEDHADYHRSTDRVDRIDPGFYYRSVRTIAEFVRRLDRSLDAVAGVRAAAASHSP